jgi:hypothetical protein
MELNSRVFKVALASAMGLFAIIGSQEESVAGDYRYLCTSVPGACEYAPNTAPTLSVDVCWNGTQAFLKGAGDCPSGSWAYFIDSGEVINAVTNQVQPYVKLDDTCKMGYCEPMPVNPPMTTEGPLCCGSGGCVELADGTTCSNGEVAVWCDEGEEVELGEDGEWECYEAG